MEKLKEPQVFFTAGTAVGLFVTSAYFYKQLEMQKQLNEEYRAALTNVWKIVTELKAAKTEQDDLRTVLEKKVKALDDQVFKHAEDFEDLLETLEENDIQVEMPVPSPPKRRGRRDEDRESRDTRDSVESRSSRRGRGRNAKDSKETRQVRRGEEEEDYSGLVERIKRETN